MAQVLKTCGRKSSKVRILYPPPMRKNKSFIPGYVIGGSLVLIIFPLIFYVISQRLDGYFGGVLIENLMIRWVLMLILLGVGGVFGVWSIIIQRKIGQGGPLEGYKINVSPKTKKLNTTGPYRYTRNPMLFGTCSLYLAEAMFFNSMAFLLLVITFAIFMVNFVRRTEEKRLLKDFGEEYARYRRRTSLFFPWLPKAE